MSVECLASRPRRRIDWDRQITEARAQNIVLTGTSKVIQEDLDDSRYFLEPLAILELIICVVNHAPQAIHGRIGVRSSSPYTRNPMATCTRFDTQHNGCRCLNRQKLIGRQALYYAIVYLNVRDQISRF